MLRALAAMVACAGIAVGAISAPAMVAAEEWDVNGAPVGSFPGVAVEGGGTFAFTMDIGVPVTTECDVDVAMSVWNVFGFGEGSVSVFDPWWLSCVVTGVSNCLMSSVSAATPWTLSTWGTLPTMSGVNFLFSYVSFGGGTCPIAGTRQLAGSVRGVWSDPAGMSPGKITFVNEPGLKVGGAIPAVVNGSVYLAPEAGGDLYLR